MKLSEVNITNIDGEMTNAQRARASLDAVITFAEWSGQVNLAKSLGEEPGSEDAVLEVLGDLIANLMHLANWHEVDVNDVIGRAFLHYEDEISEEGEPA